MNTPQSNVWYTDGSYHSADNTVVNYMLLGDSGVGKTTLFRHLIGQSVIADELPTEELSCVDVAIQNTHIKLWDSSVKLQYVIKPMLSKIDGYIVVADLSQCLALQNVSHWVNLAMAFGKPDSGIVIIGNKQDEKITNASEIAGSFPFVEIWAFNAEVTLEHIHALFSDQRLNSQGSNDWPEIAEDAVEEEEEDISEGIFVRRVPDTSLACEGIYTQEVNDQLNKIDSMFDGPNEIYFESSAEIYSEQAEIGLTVPITSEKGLNCSCARCMIF